MESQLIFQKNMLKNVKVYFFFYVCIVSNEDGVCTTTTLKQF